MVASWMEKVWSEKDRAENVVEALVAQFSILIQTVTCGNSLSEWLSISEHIPGNLLFSRKMKIN